LAHSLTLENRSLSRTNWNGVSYKCWSEAEIVLRVDLKKTDPELGAHITTLCSEFGAVRSVKIHRGQKNFALVEMATHDQAHNLAAFYQRTLFGGCVLLYLKHENRKARRSNSSRAGITPCQS
jgi:hypothetical protein